MIQTRTEAAVRSSEFATTLGASATEEHSTVAYAPDERIETIESYATFE